MFFISHACSFGHISLAPRTRSFCGVDLDCWTGGSCATRVQILKQDWPHNWPNFISDLVAASKTNETLCTNNMHILMILRCDIWPRGVHVYAFLFAGALFSLVYMICVRLPG